MGLFLQSILSCIVIVVLIFLWRFSLLQGGINVNSATEHSKVAYFPYIIYYQKNSKICLRIVFIILKNIISQDNMYLIIKKTIPNVSIETLLSDGQYTHTLYFCWKWLNGAKYNKINIWDCCELFFLSFPKINRSKKYDHVELISHIIKHPIKLHKFIL